MSEKKNDNLAIWVAAWRPPKTALKRINGGRMAGKTDINPQWRYEKLTELFGPVGLGWWTEETRREFVPCGDEIAVFVDLELHIKGYDHPINGNGGNVFRVKEKDGLRLNDEAIKMATTDAMSVCCKQLGIGSAIYEGKWNGSKYADDAPNPRPQPKPKTKPAAPDKPDKFHLLEKFAKAKEMLGKDLYYMTLGGLGYEKANEIPVAERQAVLDELRAVHAQLEAQKAEK